MAERFKNVEVPPPQEHEKLLLYTLGLKLLGKGLNFPLSSLPLPVSRADKEVKQLPVNKAVLPTPNVEDVNGNRRKRDNDSVGLTDCEKKEKRRKMNRVAAQTARDRKKQYVQDLEEKLAKLEKENQQLLAENGLLKKKTTTLMAEKRDLEQMLVLPSPTGSASVCADNSTTSHESSLLDNSFHGDGDVLELAGSAVPLVSRQQKQAPHFPALLGNWMVISLVLSIAYQTSSLEVKENLRHLLFLHSPPTSKNRPRVTELSQAQLLRLLRRWGGRMKAHNTLPPPPMN